MGSAERPPKPDESANVPEGEIDEWNYVVVERYNGDKEHDRVLKERAELVNELTNEPLPEDIVKDIDAVVSNRMSELIDEEDEIIVTSDSSLFDKELANLAGELKAEERASAAKGGTAEEAAERNHYSKLIEDLSGDEKRQPKSLNDIWQETGQLKGADKTKQLRALRIVSLALNNAQPSHTTEAEWVALDEEAKALTRVAEITKYREEMGVAEGVYRHSDITAEEKVQHAQTLGEPLKVYASGDDIPEETKKMFDRAAERTKYVTDNFEEIDSQKDRPNKEVKPTDEPEEPIDDIQPADNLEEIKEDTQPKEVTEETAPEVKPMVDKEKLKEDIPRIQEQLKEHIKNNDHFKAAQLLARMKRIGVGRKKKEGENKLNKTLAAGFEKMLENNERDGGVTAARYLTYLKYTGVLGNLSKEDRDRMVKSVGIGFETAAKEEKEGVNWSLYAMHAKYVGAIDDVDKEQSDLLFVQAQTISNGGNTDKVVTNEARLKYLKEESHVTIPDKEVQQRLTEHKREGKYGEYSKLTNAYRYIGGKVPVRDDDVEKLHQHLENERSEATQSGDWNRYLVDAASAAKTVEERSEEDYIVSIADEETTEPTDTAVEDEVLDDNPKKEEQSEKDTIITAGDTVVDGGEVSDDKEPDNKEDSDGAPSENIFKLSERGLKKQIDTIENRARERREGKDKITSWAQEVVDQGIDITEDEKEKISVDQEELAQKKEQGIDLTKDEKERLSSDQEIIAQQNRVGRIEAVLEERLKRRIRTNPEEEKALNKYHDLWLNELGRLDAMRKDKKIGRATEYFMALAKLGTVKQRIKARQSYINMLREAALDKENVTADRRALLTAMSDEYEELSIRERLGSLSNTEKAQIRVMQLAEEGKREERKKAAKKEKKKTKSKKEKKSKKSEKKKKKKTATKK